MTTGRNRWWRMAAIAVVGCGAVTGGWYSFVQATSADENRVGSAPPAFLPIAVVESAQNPATENQPETAPATPASGTLPIPTPSGGNVVLPAVPTVPPVPLPPSVPASPPAPMASAEPPIAMPVIPPIPAVPSVTPTPATHVAPPTELPPLPGVSGGTIEPPKLPITPALPDEPLLPVVPPPAGKESAQPILPMKPDSVLKPSNTGNTLNSTAPPITPPTDFGGNGREKPGTKPSEMKLEPSDKFVFPVPSVPNSLDSQRDDTMRTLTTTAAFAVLSGALLAAEKANASFPTVPSSPIVPTPGMLVKADDKEVTQLKKDLDDANKKIADANKKIEELEKSVVKLSELLNGRKEPFEAGAVATLKDLNAKLDAIQKELSVLKTQTALKPAVTPEIPAKGIVKIINEYPVEISIVVNDKSYRIAPSRVLDIEVPSGYFTYQLLTAGATETKSLIQKDETVKLRIK